MIAGILGKLGRGKTVLMTALAYITYTQGSFFVKRMLFPEIFDLSNNTKIYSNYKLSFPFTGITTPEELNNVQEGSAFMDEFGLWCDSRMSMSKKNMAVNNIALTSRKRNNNIFYTAQNWSRVDKRIRNITDVLIVPNYNMRTGMIAVKVLEPSDRYEEVIKKFNIPAKPFFDMYNTKEEIKSPVNNEEDVSQKKVRKPKT